MTRTILLMLVLNAFAGCADTDPLSPDSETSAADANAPSESTGITTTIDDAPQKKSVVALTDAAAAKVREFKKEIGLPYLRVSVSPGGCTGFMYDLRFDDELNADSDYLDESHGLKIVVDRKSALYIDGASIDWQVLDDGREGFHFDNPNAVKPSETEPSVGHGAADNAVSDG